MIYPCLIVPTCCDDMFSLSKQTLSNVIRELFIFMIVQMIPFRLLMNEKILLTKLFRLNLIESPLLLHCVEAQLQLRQENR